MKVFVVVLAILLTCREIAAFNNGDIYLSSPNGELSNRGVVQIEINGTIGYICEEGFNEAAAAAACRQVGFANAVNFEKLEEGTFPGFTPEGKPLFKDVHCSGYQLHILRCSTNRIQDDDTNCAAVVVNCENTTITENPYYGQVQLLNEDSPVKSEGTLEVYIDSKWREVCAADINEPAASSVCRQLGYTNALPLGSTMSDNPLQLNTTCETKSEQCFLSCIRDNGEAEQCKDVVKITCTFDESMSDDLTAGFCNYSAVGAIVGGVLGGIAAVVLIGVIIIITAICFLSPSCYVNKKIKRKGYSGV